MFEAQNFPNQVHLVDPTTMPPPPPPPPVPPLALPAPPVVVDRKFKAKPFIRQLWLYFEARATEFPTARKSVIFALSYMRGGTASPWADNLIDKIIDDDDMDQDFRFLTFSDFATLFIERFRERDENTVARHKMTQLKQGTLTVDELIA